MNTLEPHGRMRLPDPVIDVGEPTVGIAAADRRNEERHLLVTSRYVENGVRVPNNPGRLIGTIDLEEQETDRDDVPGEVEPRVGDAAPPPEYRHETGDEIDQDDLVDGPQLGRGLPRS